MKLSSFWMRTVRIAMSAATVFMVAACGNRDLVAPTPVAVDVLLVGQSTGTTSSKLAWQADGNTDLSYGIRIYRDEVLVATLTAEQLGAGWVDKGLKPGTTYRYRVAVLKKDGTEAMSSNTIFVTTAPAAIKLAIAPGKDTVVAGQTAQLAAIVLDSATNEVLDGYNIVWGTSNGTVATVSQTGVVTAHAPGIMAVSAATQGALALKTVTVIPAPTAKAASITVSPAVSTVEAGKTAQLSAIARDANGTVLAREFAWTSSNPTIATVSQQGVVTSIAAGLVTIRATTDDLTGTAQVTVLSTTDNNNDVASVTVAPRENALLVGGSVLLTATVRNAQGQVLVGRTITWTSENAAIATVSATGAVSAKAAGSTVIVASTGGASGSAIVTVSNIPSAPQPEPVASITLTPASTTISLGGSAQFIATLKDASGAVLTGRTIVWTTSSALVAQIAPDGRVLGISAGQATITAASEGMSATATVIVQENAPPPVSVSSLTVAPAQVTLPAGQTSQLTATTRDVSGNVLTGRVVTWSSSNPAIAVVSPTGLVTAVSGGSVTITATSEGQTGTAQVVVPSIVVSTVSTVTVAPSSITTAIGTSTQYIAVLKDAQGLVLVGRTVVWTSSDPTVATVSASGLATSLKAGTVTITATSEGKSGTATLTVNPVPVALVVLTPPVAVMQVTDTIRLTAITRSILGIQLLGRPMTWTSSDPSIATVSQTGLVTAVSTGAVIITATSEGIPGIAAITVGLKPVGTITVAPTTLSLTAGHVDTLRATTRDVDGNVVNGRLVLWTSSNSSVALVSPNGVVTAVSGGTATITATSEGKSATATVTVSALVKPVATFTVTPGTLSLTALATAQLTAEAKDDNGVVLTGRAVVWTSSNPLVASVSPTGLVLALVPGTTTITATSEGKTATVNVTVTIAIKSVHTVTVTPSTLPLVAGSSAPVSVTLKDEDGVVLTGRVVTFSSSNTNVATVSITGNVTAVAAGTAIITATSEGKNGTSTVNVSALVMPVGSISLSPSPVNLASGATAQVTATIKDANGATLTGRTVVWTSSNPLVATVSQSGVVTGVTAGSTQITATSEGVSGVATANITAGQLASIQLTSPNGLCAGAQLQLNATLLDAQGNLITGKAIVWTTSNAQLATVSNNGLLVGLKVGTVRVTATVDGVSAYADVTLCAPVVATVEVTAPNNLLSILGLPMQLLAVAKDGNGNVIPNLPITWSIAPTSRALLSGTGLVTPLLSGGITITATIGGVSSTINLSIGL